MIVIGSITWMIKKCQKENAMSIPSTVSPLAQEFLRNNRPFIVKPKNLSEWSQLKNNFLIGMKKLGQKAYDEFVESAVIIKIANVDVLELTPKNYDKKNDGKAIIFIHGGGFVVGDPSSYHMVQAPIAYSAGLKLYSINYRLAPEYPFPMGMNDCLDVYREMLKKFHHKDIVFCGDSAGGNMVLSTILAAKNEGLPMPKSLALLSPWADLNEVGDSYYTLKGKDPILDYEKNLKIPAMEYSKGNSLINPLISPLYSDYFPSFPKTLIITGTRDLFLSNCVRLYQKMKKAKVDVRIDVWEGMWHVFQDNTTEEAKESAAEIGTFLMNSLGS